ncbi:histidine kinase [Pedobacter nutrimenti]|uniref:histidine kinase n=1 Tax=Pedobacter nutrimenti TaxID=1241337 RepID=UPI00292E3EC9|nr:histidine kinase [Pedobacter nutrimenti]
MNDINPLQPKEYKWHIIGLHFLAITWIIGIQALMILSIQSTVSWKGCLIFTVQAVIYLASYYWVFPKLFGRKTIGVFFLRLSIIVSIYLLVRGFVIYRGKNIIEFFYFILSLNQFIFSFLHLTLIIGLNFFIGFYRRSVQLNQKYIKALRGILEAEMEKARIESMVTQMRLSPHLMFNTLNFIKQKADEIIPEIGKAVDLFSGIVHHSMIDILNEKTVLLSKEIAKVKDQIELHKQLADGLVHIDFEEEYIEPMEDAMIPPSTLLTFIENVFRYGLVKDPDYPPSIRVAIIGRQFTFTTWNYKRNDPHHGSGMGIKSVATTLGYYYPGLHTLSIENLEETFRLTLTIQL